MKKQSKTIWKKGLSLLLALAMIIPMCSSYIAQAEETSTQTLSWDFSSADQLDDFTLYQVNENDAFTIKNGYLVSNSGGGTRESKAIYNESIQNIKSISVNMYSRYTLDAGGGALLYYGGFYVGLSDVTNDFTREDNSTGLEGVTGLCFRAGMRENSSSDPARRQKGVLRVTSETLTSSTEIGVKEDTTFFASKENDAEGVYGYEPINLRLDFDGNNVTFTMTQINNPTKSISETYTLDADDFNGKVGLRADRSNFYYDNFEITYQSSNTNTTTEPKIYRVGFNKARVGEGVTISSSGWKDSTVVGSSDKWASLCSNSKGATITYKPTSMEPGWYTVNFWNIAHKQTPMKMTATISANGKNVQLVPGTVTKNGWTDLGTYYFAGTGNEYLSMKVNASEHWSRVADVKFVQVLDENKIAALEVDNLIDKIGTVSAEKEHLIKAARNAYDALTTEQKALVTKLDVLVVAENTYKNFKEYIVYTDSSGFSKTGSWTASGMKVGEHSTFYLKTEASGSFTFKASQIPAGEYTVYYYSLYNTASMNLNVKVGGENAFSKTLVAVSKNTNANGWARLGNVELDAVGDVSVTYSGSSENARASAIKLVSANSGPEGTVTLYACNKGVGTGLSTDVTIFPETAHEYSDGAYRAGWAYSNQGTVQVDGHDTLVTMMQNAKCTFTLKQDKISAGKYKVYYYTYANGSVGTPEMTFRVKEGDTLVGKVVKATTLANTAVPNSNVTIEEWVDCGEVTLMGIGDVKIEYTSPGNIIGATNARATAVKLVPIESATPSTPDEVPTGMRIDSFSYSGDWLVSNSLKGPLDDYPTTMWIDRSTIANSDVTAYENNYCQYNLPFESREAKVYVWLLHCPYGQTNNVTYEVHSGDEVEKFTIDMTTVTKSGWYQLGTDAFEFSDTAAKNFVRLVCTNANNYQVDTTFRASVVRFDLQGESQNIHQYDSTLYVYPNPENKVLTHVNLGPLGDIPKDDPIRYDVEYMYNEGYVTGTSGTTFSPNENITESDFLTFLNKVLTKYNVTYTAKQLQSGVNIEDEDTTLTKEEIALILNNTISVLNKHTEWLSSLIVDYSVIKDIEDISDGAIDAIDVMYRCGVLTINDEGKLLPQKNATRGEATVMLKRFTQQFVQASPAIDSNDDWVMTFNDEFHGTELNWDVWTSSDQDYGHILCSRHPENAEVHDGAVHLVAKYESRYPGKYWTAGDIFADKVFKQEYGYWECRYKIAAAPDTNNSFWCMTAGTAANDVFEIDFNEGHYPNEITNTYHEYRTNNGKISSQSKWTYSNLDLSEDYHTYACEWDSEHVNYYFDGKLTATLDTRSGGTQVWPRLSLAILRRENARITPEHDGAAMVVDYVRIWQREDNLDNYTTVQDGVLDEVAVYSLSDYVKAMEAEQLIEAIGTVTKDSGNAINAARTAYDNLTDTQKQLVKNLDKLTAAENAYEQIVNNNAKAKEAEELIDAIGTVTKDSGNAIEAARTAYDSLTDAQKQLVKNLDKLTAAENAYEQIVKDNAKAKEAEELIDAIGTVTKDSGNAINAARTAYDNLTDAQKQLVKNLDKLTAAEATYEQLLKDDSEQEGGGNTESGGTGTSVPDNKVDSSSEGKTDSGSPNTGDSAMIMGTLLLMAIAIIALAVIEKKRVLK